MWLVVSFRERRRQRISMSGVFALMKVVPSRKLLAVFLKLLQGRMVQTGKLGTFLWKLFSNCCDRMP